jgi:signal transduction histidine kinase
MADPLPSSDQNIFIPESDPITSFLKTHPQFARAYAEYQGLTPSEKDSFISHDIKSFTSSTLIFFTMLDNRLNLPKVTEDTPDYLSLIEQSLQTLEKIWQNIQTGIYTQHEIVKSPTSEYPTYKLRVENLIKFGSILKKSLLFLQKPTESTLHDLTQEHLDLQSIIKAIFGAKPINLTTRTNPEFSGPAAIILANIFANMNKYGLPGTISISYNGEQLTAENLSQNDLPENLFGFGITGFPHKGHGFGLAIVKHIYAPVSNITVENPESQKEADRLFRIKFTLTF